jgi:hypothetical protein
MSAEQRQAQRAMMLSVYQPPPANDQDLLSLTGKTPRPPSMKDEANRLWPDVYNALPEFRRLVTAGHRDLTVLGSPEQDHGAAVTMFISYVRDHGLSPAILAAQPADVSKALKWVRYQRGVGWSQNKERVAGLLASRGSAEAAE